MNKIEALTDGSFGNREVSDGASEKRKVPRRDPPSIRLELVETSNAEHASIQEAMDAENTAESAADAENNTESAAEASALQKPRKQRASQGSETTAVLEILEAIRQMQEGFRQMQERVEALSVRHERLAAKVSTLSQPTTSKTAALRQERANRIKESIAQGRGHVQSANDDGSEIA